MDNFWSKLSAWLFFTFGVSVAQQYQVIFFILSFLLFFEKKLKQQHKMFTKFSANEIQIRILRPPPPKTWHHRLAFSCFENARNRFFA